MYVIIYIDAYKIINNINLGKIPIMVGSNYCVLRNQNINLKKTEECLYDNGGYFIIDGKEKCIMSQEGRANNMLYIKDDFSEEYICSAEIKSVSEDTTTHSSFLCFSITK